MNEKERIIELVRQNVITMEEAIKLLEAAGRKDTLNDSKEQVDLSKEVDESSTSENAQTGSFKAASKNDNDKIEKVVDTLVDKGIDWTGKLANFIRKSIDEKQKSKPIVTNQEPADRYAKEYQAAQEEVEEKYNNNISSATVNALDQEIKNIDENLTPLLEELDKVKEEHIITQQRLRELEIFSELDDLTPEMLEQKTTLTTKDLDETTKIIDLENQIQEFQARKGQLQGDKLRQLGEDSKEFIKNKTNDLTKTTQKFAEDAVREGSKVSKAVTESVKDLVKNFDMKDMNVSFEVPWLKNEKIDHTFEFEGNNIEDINIRINNGSVDISTYEGEKVIIESQLRFHGNVEATTPEYFTELSEISTDEKTLLFNVTHPKLSLDAHIKLPNKTYHELKVHLMNGNCNISKIDCDEIEINNKNGDIIFESTQASLLNVMNLAGNINLNQLQVKDILVKTLSGEIRIEGGVENFSAETTSGNIFITKTDDANSNFQLKTLSGDIKVAQNDDLNLEIEAKTTSGVIAHRLEQLNIDQINAELNKGILQRTTDSSKSKVTINATVVSGDIRFKDNVK